jgi:hypothetical protein
MKRIDMRHDPITKGIFVQRNVGYANSRQYRKPFCVTFPRLANLGKDTCDVLYPSKDFATYQQALEFAREIQRMDSRLRDCKLYLLDHRWVRSSTERTVVRIF